MADELRESIQTLRTLAPKLNQVTDQATETVKAVEKFLDENGVGVAAYACVDSRGDGPEGTYIGYLRHSGKFRIVVVDADADGVDRRIRTWYECSRDEKLDSFDRLPDLLAHIAKQLQERIDRTANSVRLVSEFLTALASK